MQIFSSIKYPLLQTHWPSWQAECFGQGFSQTKTNSLSKLALDVKAVDTDNCKMHKLSQLKEIMSGIAINKANNVGIMFD